VKDIGVLSTPGYERVALRMQSAAEQADMSMTIYRVKTQADVGPAIREAVFRSDLVWVVGDPLLTQDFIFGYLLQESFRSKKPLAAPLPGLVKKGALFCTVPDWDAVARAASQVLSQILDPAGGPLAQRIQYAPEGGGVMVNRLLTQKWGISVPASLRLSDEPAP
jgi:ABC-type uncharacterized transport system substrate-binding protein